MLLFPLLGLTLLSALSEGAEQCEDLYRGCEVYTADGWCKSADTAISSFMKMNCRKTCGFCDGTNRSKRQAVELCEDLYRGCGVYTADGWCESTDTALSSFMKVNCRKTCGFCGGVELQGTLRSVLTKVRFSLNSNKPSMQNVLKP
ncbi:ShTK domain protein, partial [Trichostrongylus colubriformis]